MQAWAWVHRAPSWVRVARGLLSAHVFPSGPAVRVAVGPIVERNVRALVARPGALTTSLLGHTFLDRLDSYLAEVQKAAAAEPERKMRRKPLRKS